MTESFLSQRRRWFYLIATLLSLCCLQSIAADDATDRLRRNQWDIINPTGKKCLAKSNAKDASSFSSDRNSTACEDSSSAIRMEYKIHKNVKYPKYELFRKHCKERYETGAEPVRGFGSPDEINLNPLSLSSEFDNDDFVATASIEILPIKDNLPSSWWDRLSNTKKRQHTVEFCVRMGTWLSPEINMEVNFRETNVIVTFNTTASDNDDGGDIIVDSFELNTIDLVTITIELPGAKPKVEGAKPKLEGAKPEVEGTEPKGVDDGADSTDMNVEL